MADALQSINVVDLEIGVRLQCAPCLSLLPLASAFRCGLTVVEVDRTPFVGRGGQGEIMCKRILEVARSVHGCSGTEFDARRRTASSRWGCYGRAGSSLPHRRHCRR